MSNERKKRGYTNLKRERESLERLGESEYKN